MKILVVGHNNESRQAFAAKIREHYPDAELVFSEDLPNPEEGQRSTGVWIDECSDFPAEVVLTCPMEYKLNTYHDLPKREKVMHPWSRRKKR